MISTLLQKFSKMMRPATPVSPTDAMNMLAEANAVLLDVREAGEIQNSGKAKGARTVPLSVLTNKTALAAGLKTDQPILIYCATGMRSSMAGRKLSKMGYGQLYNLGGFESWKAAGGSVSK